MIGLIASTLIMAPPAQDAPVKPAETPAEKPAAVSWRFHGTLSDGAGTVRFRLKGDRISHASAQVRGRSYTLRPSDLNDGRFQLIGNHEKDYIRIKAKLRRAGRWVSGTFEGAVNRKRIRGNFTASRR